MPLDHQSKCPVVQGGTDLAALGSETQIGVSYFCNDLMTIPFAGTEELHYFRHRVDSKSSPCFRKWTCGGSNPGVQMASDASTSSSLI